MGLEWIDVDLLRPEDEDGAFLFVLLKDGTYDYRSYCEKRGFQADVEKWLSRGESIYMTRYARLELQLKIISSWLNEHRSDHLDLETMDIGNERLVKLVSAQRATLKAYRELVNAELAILNVT